MTLVPEDFGYSDAEAELLIIRLESLSTGMPGTALPDDALEQLGIDIEKQRPIITNIAKKFVDYEFEYLKEDCQNYVNKLTTIWCAKESLYKLFATPGLSFKKHIMVIPFTIEEASTICWIDYNDKKYRYNTSFFEFDGFTCAYAIQ